MTVGNDSLRLANIIKWEMKRYIKPMKRVKLYETSTTFLWWNAVGAGSAGHRGRVPEFPDRSRRQSNVAEQWYLNIYLLFGDARFEYRRTALNSLELPNCRERESACSLFGTLDRLFFLLFRDLLLSDACTTHREKKKEKTKRKRQERRTYRKNQST